jgi:transcriptional regulator with XRE-family HTH domain
MPKKSTTKTATSDKATWLIEGQKLNRFFELAKEREGDSLTQDSLALEMSVTQGLITQWVTGRTPIPDRRLIWLGNRLNFSPLDIRPSLADLLAVNEPAATYSTEETQARMMQELSRLEQSGQLSSAASQELLKIAVRLSTKNSVPGKAVEKE